MGLHPLSSLILRIVQWKPVTSCPETSTPQRAGLGGLPGGQAVGQLASLDTGQALPAFPPRSPAVGCPLELQGHSLVFLPASPPWLGICLPTCILFESPLGPESHFCSSFQFLVVGGQQLVRAWQRVGSWGRQRGEATSCSRGCLEFLSKDWAGCSGWGECSPLRYRLNCCPWGSPAETPGMRHSAAWEHACMHAGTHAHARTHTGGQGFSVYKHGN